MLPCIVGLKVTKLIIYLSYYFYLAKVLIQIVLSSWITRDIVAVQFRIVLMAFFITAVLFL